MYQRCQQYTVTLSYNEIFVPQQTLPSLATPPSPLTVTPEGLACITHTFNTLTHIMIVVFNEYTTELWTNGVCKLGTPCYS